MKQIPENRADIREILCQQLALLAEQSKNREPLVVVELTKAMIEIAKVLEV